VEHSSSWESDSRLTGKEILFGNRIVLRSTLYYPPVYVKVCYEAVCSRGVSEYNFVCISHASCAFYKTDGNSSSLIWTRLNISHYATSQKGVGSIPCDVNRFFNWPNKSFQLHYGRGVDSASNRNESRNLPWGIGRLVRKGDNLTAISDLIV
jgi:hypothetical protein